MKEKHCADVRDSWSSQTGVPVGCREGLIGGQEEKVTKDKG